MFGGKSIIEDSVQFADLEGRGVVVITHADGEVPL